MSSASKPPTSKLTGSYYGDYLHLDKLLGAQKPRSNEAGQPAHDEMLFIIIHQAYELWFKQILHEFGSVMPIFADTTLDERNMGTVIARLKRVVEIQRVLNDQLTILGTMTPLDFLDFRDFLIPASGFQSVQFRHIEVMLGLRQGDRASFSQDAYRKHLSEEDRAFLENRESQTSLIELVEQWLERIPFLDVEGYSFWNEYEQAVKAMLDNEAAIIGQSSMLSEAEKRDQLEQHADTGKNFQILMNKEAHDELRQKGERRLSHRAMSAAVFIELYRDYPALQLPHKMLGLLVDIDELFTTWRQRHAIMVHRMIGRKIGTGGSAGHRYLRDAADKHRVFTDLFDLPTYLIPRSALPKLPEAVEKRLHFTYQGLSGAGSQVDTDG